MPHRPWFRFAVCLLLAAQAAAKQRAVLPVPAPSQLTAYPDSYSVGQGKVLNVAASRGVLINDRDPQRKPLIAILVANPIHGSLTFNPDGSFIYTNDGTGAATDSFTYQASNGTTRSNIAAVTITMGAADAIVANPETYSLGHGATINVAAPGVLGNDTDPSGAPLIANVAVPPTHGVLTLNASGAFTYTHDGSNTTADSFAYRATDGILTSAPALVILNIGADVPPTVASQSYSTTQNTPLSIGAPGILTGAFDPDSPTLIAVLQSSTTHGSLALSPNGAFVYSPATGFTGADSFTYRSSDGIFTSLASGTASITVSPLPQPLAVDDRYVATTPTLTISAPGILGNDALNGATLASFGVHGNDQSGIGHPAVTSKNGQITLNADGSFTYVAPSPTFAGEDTVQYIIRNGAAASTATVIITVAPVNTNCGTIAISPAVLPPASTGSVYPAVSFAQSGGTAPVTWSSGMLPPGMSLSPSGVLSGTPLSLGVFNITIVVTDAKGCSAVASLTLNVNCGSIAIGTANPTPAVAAVAYTPFTFSATGGSAPLVWTTADPLPGGMTLSSAGVLSGTPAQTGSFPFIVSVTDANGCHGSRLVTLVVNARCPSIAITVPTLPAATLGVLYPTVTFQSSGGTAPYTWSVVLGALPAGMTLSPQGVLSGTPLQNGTFTFSVQATDSSNCPSAAQSTTLSVGRSCGSITVSPSSLTAPINQFYSAALTQSGGALPVTWSITGLPTGLTSSTTGVISGTPNAAGIANVNVTVTDANGCTGSAVVTIVITSCPTTISITAPTLPAATVGSAYPSATFQAAGGTGPYTWNVVLGTLPAGMTLSTQGVLSGTPTQNGAFTFSVQAIDANNCASASQSVTLRSCGAITVSPAALTAPINQSYSAALTQSGGVAPVTWSITGLPTGLTSSTTGVISGTPTTAGTFNASVTVTDANGCTGSAVVTIVITSCPTTTISITAPTLPAATVGASYPSATFQAAGGTAPYTWSVVLGTLPAGMTLSTQGVLSGTPTQNGSFTFSVQAIDANNCASASQSVTLRSCGAINVAPASLTAPINQFYSAALTQSGGVAPVTWTITGLPTGLTSSTTGVISGTPTAAGTFNANVTVTDANGCTGNAVVTIVITSCPTTISITAPTLPAATVGSAYPSATFQAAGGTAPYTWNVVLGTLPAGMTLSTQGVLSGTPTQNGSFTFSVQAIDANNCASASQSVTLRSCGAITISPTSLTAPINQSYSAALTQTGGVAPVTWTITGLPTGLTSSTTGVISGTPTAAGTFNANVTVTDANGCTGNAVVTIVITSCPTTISITAPTLPAATVGAIYPSATFRANGGTAPYTWNVVLGSLPAGMTLSAQGVLSGTPTQNGVFTFRVQAIDANNCASGTQNVTLRICSTITISPSSLTAPINQLYSAALTQSGGVAPVTWLITDLPNGLTSSTTGVISGTPTTAGSVNANVTVTDANGCTGSAVVTIVITAACPTITVNALTLPNAMQGAIYPSATFRANGGTAPYTWNVVLGVLPTGMTVSPQGVLSGTPAQSGTFTFSVQAIDANNCPSNARSMTLTVSQACPAITISPLSLTGRLNVLFAAALTQSGGVAPLTWTASGLPNDLAISTTGVISGTPSLAGTFNANVTATDANGCTGNAVVTIVIASCPTISITAPTLPAATVGAAYPSATFQAGGGAAPYTWSVVLGVLPNGMTLSTQGVLSGTPAQNGTFTFSVQATDANGCTASTATSVSLTVNKACSTITISPASLLARLNTSFAAALTQSGGVAPLTWTATSRPQGLTMSSTGVLSGTPTQAGTFNMNVTVTDANNCVGTAVVTVIVSSCGTVTVNPPALPAATQGAIYPTVTFQATGGTGPYTWSIVVGALPTGMTFSATGILSGTPAQSGTFNFKVQAVDVNGCISNAPGRTLIVNAICSATINITASPLASPTDTTKLIGGSLNVPYNAVFSQTGGAIPVVWSATGVPPGLTMSASGSLSGSPTASGGYRIAVMVTDTNGCTKTSIFTLSVHPLICPGIVVNPPALPVATQGLAYPNATFDATGGTRPYSFSISFGTLPSGMTFTSGGVLSGVPAQSGSFTFTVLATDANGCLSAPLKRTLTVNPTCNTITIFPAALPHGTVDVTYAIDLTQTGGTGNVTWLPGILPPGLTLSTQGLLSGTPTTQGTFDVGVTVTDANGCSKSTVRKLIVNAPVCTPITITPTSLSSGTVGTQYPNVQFDASGGTSPYTFVVESGSLANGLTLSTGGLLSGTPTLAGSFTFSIVASQTNGCASAPATYTLVINPACALTVTGTPPNGQTGAAYSNYQFSTSGGGSGTVTWSITNPPPGLTLGSTGILGGTPTALGTFTFTVTAQQGLCTASQNFSITVTCGTITVSANAALDTAVNDGLDNFTTVTGAGYAFEASGGTAPYSFSATGQPSDLSIQSNGVLAGSTGIFGDYYITVTVVDANGCTGSLVYYFPVDLAL